MRKPQQRIYFDENDNGQTQNDNNYHLVLLSFLILELTTTETLNGNAASACFSSG
ncbi:hypothetical protein Pecwa_2572 [Pectobacterium parmentieri WPP163]|uniref:Uncharacterized protein n=1 Tax=Pectobacterium parmentieri TaxID=1905730 RepID=A0A0H3I4W0_PECPM|nr:hypothetical protein Pecwa_2572 [Pectobacterium parmentieri WPP163]AFI90635.1 Hypothetical protein W5S_2547 [Pectobacterium parmentieri]POW27942.1 hypothetical protein PB20LOC_01878 [Pectobacterium parmentieri]